MLARRSLSTLFGSTRWRFSPRPNLCTPRLWRIGLAGVFLWAISGSFGRIGAIAADLETIRDRGELVVGVKDTLRPLGFRDDLGQLQGLEIDLARELAKDLLGDPEAIAFVVLPNDERLEAVYDRVDVTIAQVGVNESRERLVQFSLPYWIDGTALLVRDCGAADGVGAIGEASRCPERAEDLATATIAVLHGSDAIAALQWQFPRANLTGVESYQAGLDRLESGEVEAFAGDRSVAIGWTQGRSGYRVLPNYITARSLAIVLPKGMQYATLRAAVNDSLEAWRTSGWLEARLKAWGLLDATGDRLAPDSANPRVTMDEAASEATNEITE